ncbi:MFS transporter [Staphylospora marina]|uniref:MFS transporter n=1 Tax=Staphylospora marina TaxID=2490858 RepID=UPI000F5C2000|nr:MFS transporter [Staphylospora marina]
MKKSGSLWKNRAFVRLYAAVSIAMFGTYLDVFAVAVLIGYVWKADPVLVGLVPVMYALPGVLLGSWAGVLADRFDRRKIMIAADLCTAGVTFLMMLAPNVFWLLALLLIRSAFSVVFYPAQQALTKRIVPHEQLGQAMTWNGLADQAAKIASPFLGAMLITVVTPQICLLVKGLTNLASASLLTGLRDPEATAETEPATRREKTAWSDWTEGWRVVRKNRMLLSTLAFWALGIFVVQMVDSQFPVLFRELFPESPQMMGWIISMVGAGGVLGALSVQRAERIQAGWLLGGGLAVIGSGFGMLSLLTPATPVFSGFVIGFISGVGIGAFLVTFQTVLQRETEKDSVGRVFGIQSSLANVLLIIGPMAGSWLVKGLGVRPVYALVGVAVFTVGMTGILLRNRLWKKPDPATVESWKENVTAD